MPQRRIEHGSEFGAVTPRCDSQQLRVAQITNHRQRVVLHLLRQPREHRLVDHGIAGLGLQHLTQRIGLTGRGQHGDIGIVAGEELGDRSRPDGGNQFARVQVLQVDGARTAAITDEQTRNAQEGIAVAPQPQASRRLAQARRHIDQALAGGLFQRVFVSEAAPVQAHAEIVRQMLHQLHMKP